MLSVEDFTMALSIILDAIGNAMGTGEIVDIDFGDMIGHLQCEGRTLKPTFIQATPEVTMLTPSLNVTLDRDYMASKAHAGGLHFSKTHSPSHMVMTNVRKPGM